MHIWGYWYFSQKSWFQLVLHPAWHFTWYTLHISEISSVTYTVLTYSFPNLEPVCPCLDLTVASWPRVQISQEAGKVVWYSHLFKNFPQFALIHTVRGFSVVNETEVDVFLELSCFFCDLADVGSLISGSSVFSKSSLNIWKFMIHILLKPHLENFEHYFASVWDECNCVVV